VNLTSKNSQSHASHFELMLLLKNILFTKYSRYQELCYHLLHIANNFIIFSILFYSSTTSEYKFLQYRT